MTRDLWESRMEQKKRASYVGTEVNRRWYRRFLKDGMFARGRGVFWLGANGLSFLRTFTSRPIHIPWTEMTGVRLGRWHAGRWAAGGPILKIDFNRHGLDLSAGFLLSREWNQMRTLANDLQRKIRMANDGRSPDRAQTWSQ